MIVEDEPSIVTPLTFLMRQQGMEVEVVRDGAEVIPALEAHQPDVVLLDVMLPSRNGFELCEAIRQRGEWDHIKVVMLTVKNREVDMEKGLALGADDYITKPFAIDEVVTTVQKHLPSD
jgi:DNA-binding response OmpR family regulator